MSEINFTYLQDCKQHNLHNVICVVREIVQEQKLTRIGHYHSMLGVVDPSCPGQKDFLLTIFSRKVLDTITEGDIIILLGVEMKLYKGELRPTIGPNKQLLLFSGKPVDEVVAKIIRHPPYSVSDNVKERIQSIKEWARDNEESLRFGQSLQKEEASASSIEETSVNESKPDSSNISQMTCQETAAFIQAELRNLLTESEGSIGEGESKVLRSIVQQLELEDPVENRTEIFKDVIVQLENTIENLTNNWTK